MDTTTDPIQIFRDDPTFANLLWVTSLLFFPYLHVAFEIASFVFKYLWATLTLFASYIPPAFDIALVGFNFIWTKLTPFAVYFHSAFTVASGVFLGLGGSWLIWGSYVVVHVMALVLVLCVLLIPVLHGVW